MCRMSRQNLPLWFVRGVFNYHGFPSDHAIILGTPALSYIPQESLDIDEEAYTSSLNVVCTWLVRIVVLRATVHDHLNGKFRLPENESISVDSVARISDLTKNSYS
jgi:predicted glycosyltransferase